jgi:sugar phosphate isomerase/epimerase
VGAAAGAGFDAVSIWTRTHARATSREGLSEADMRMLLRDHGLVVSEIEAVDTWLPVEVAPVVGNPPLPVEAFLDLAATLEARAIVAIQSEGPDLPFSLVVEHFGRLCEAARARDLRVALEAPAFSVIDDTNKAWAIVEAAAAENGGVLLDTWHHRRSRATDADLEKIPADRFFGLQLADGPSTAEADLLQETIWRRQPPGLGDFELPALLRQLDEQGVRSVVGAEVYDEDGDHSDPAATALRLAGQLDQLFDAAGVSSFGR